MIKNILEVLAIILILLFFGPIIIICACIGRIPVSMINEKWTDISLNGRMVRASVALVGVVAWILVVYLAVCFLFPISPFPLTPTETPTPITIDTIGWSTFSDPISTIEIKSVPGVIRNAIEISYTLASNDGRWVGISRPINPEVLTGTIGIGFSFSGSGAFNTLELKLLYEPDETGQSVTFVRLWPAATVTDRRSFEEFKALYREFECGETCPPGGQLELGKVRTISFAISNAQSGASGSGTVAIDHVVGIR